jgi:preprotein translocase subunit SecE
MAILVKFTVVKPITGFITYLNEVRHELKQVVWPKKEAVIKLTLIVFLFSGLVGAYLGGLDFGFTKLLEYIISR